MGSRYLTDMADVLRAAGLAVTEQDGWKTRARGSGGFDGDRPWCVMWHHAASAPGTSTKAVADYGSFTSADRPVQNLVIGRAGDVIVCAAGATNTNGKGGPLTVSRGTVPLDQMNTHAIGIEAVNSGVGESWPQPQIDAYFVMNDALCAAYGLLPSDLASHAHWAPSRKIDPATAPAVAGPWRPRSINSSGTWHLDDMRGEAVRRASSLPDPLPPEDEDMSWTQIQIAEAGAVFMGWTADGLTPQIEWVNGDDPAVLRRYQAYVETGRMKSQTLSYADLVNCCLFGPIPQRDDRFAQNGQEWTRDKFGNVIPYS